MCGTPVTVGYATCYPCHAVRDVATRTGIPFPLDRLAFLTYAVEGFDVTRPVPVSLTGDTHERQGRQAYEILKGFKAPRTSRVLWMSAAAWTVWMLQNWAPWLPGNGAGWHWAQVPSVRSHRVGEHPLHAIVKVVLAQFPEADLRVSRSSDAREFDPERFICDQSLAGANVVLIDDSWTTGVNALSAGAALKRAGAKRVDGMMLGRLLNPARWAPTAQFIEHDGLGQGFDAARSPWISLI